MLREARWSRHGSVWGCDIAVTGPSGFLTGGVLSGAESAWGGGLMSRRFMSYNRRDAYDWQCVRVRLKHGNGTLHRRALLRVELWYVMKSVWKTGRPANECITLLQMSCVCVLNTYVTISDILRSRQLAKDHVISARAVRVATQYGPAPVLPCGRPNASRAAEQTQRSSTFPRRIRSHADRCSRLTH